MACILASLVGIYQILNTPRPTVPFAHRLLVHLPFSLYTAWICVATIANISTVQTAMGWDSIGTDPITWTYLKLALAGAIGASVIARKADIAFILVIAWAAYGISVKQIATPEVAGAATTLTILAVTLALLELVRRLYSRLN
jgi:hypothetical protein